MRAGWDVGWTGLICCTYRHRQEPGLWVGLVVVVVGFPDWPVVSVGVCKGWLMGFVVGRLSYATAPVSLHKTWRHRDRVEQATAITSVCIG